MSSGTANKGWPSDTQFENSFVSEKQYGKKSTRHILIRLERNFGHKEVVDLANATIEHILPKTMTDDWKEMLGQEYATIYARRADTFGNLTLTAYNTELGNDPFETKKEKLKNSHIELNRWICQQAQWTDSEIGKRAQILYEVSKKIWVAPYQSPEAH